MRETGLYEPFGLLIGVRANWRRGRDSPVIKSLSAIFSAKQREPAGYGYIDDYNVDYRNRENHSIRHWSAVEMPKGLPGLYRASCQQLRL